MKNESTILKNIKDNFGDPEVRTAFYECMDNADKASLLLEYYSTIKLDKMRIFYLDTPKGIVDSEDKIENIYEGEYNGMDLGDRQFQQKVLLKNLTKRDYIKILYRHIQKEINVCAFFNEQANNFCCFNVDMNKILAKDKDRLEELQLSASSYVGAIMAVLERHGITPLAYMSGHGWHIWVRFTEPIPNKDLQKFMHEVRVWSMAFAKDDITDERYNSFYDKYKCWALLYPPVSKNDKKQINVLDKTIERNSIRLFGSEHVGTGMFTHVLLDGKPLTRSESWDYLEYHMKNHSVTKDNFYQVLKEIS